MPSAGLALIWLDCVSKLDKVIGLDIATKFLDFGLSLAELYSNALCFLTPNERSQAKSSSSESRLSALVL